MTILLIDKQDNFERVCFQIAAILADETIHQQQLAIDAGKDPDLWKFDVYLESFSPLDGFKDNEEPFPVVNVWFESSNFDMKVGDVVKTQASDSSFNIDIYTSKPSTDIESGGYAKADEQTAVDLHRVIRLVRNILMHPDNAYLKLTEMVGLREKRMIWNRWISSIEKFQPQLGDRPVENVIAARMKLQVKFNENAISDEYQPLESVFVTAKRALDGKIIFEAEFDTT